MGKRDDLQCDMLMSLIIHGTSKLNWPNWEHEFAVRCTNTKLWRDKDRYSNSCCNKFHLLTTIKMPSSMLNLAKLCFMSKLIIPGILRNWLENQCKSMWHVIKLPCLKNKSVYAVVTQQGFLGKCLRTPVFSYDVLGDKLLPAYCSRSTADHTDTNQRYSTSIEVHRWLMT